MNTVKKTIAYASPLLIVVAFLLNTASLQANHHDLPSCSDVIFPQPNVNCYNTEPYQSPVENPRNLPPCTGIGTDLPNINCYQVQPEQGGEDPLEIEIDGGNPAPDPNSPAGGTQKLVNPLKAPDLETFILDIIDVLLIFAVPIIVLFIMYGGFLLVTARGDEGQIKTGKTAILWAVVGGVVALGAKLIIEVIKGTITAFGA